MEDSSESFENTHSYEEKGNDDIKLRRNKICSIKATRPKICKKSVFILHYHFPMEDSSESLDFKFDLLSKTLVIAS